MTSIFVQIYPGWPLPSCRDECPNAWVHDGYCDAACNNEECEWDGGDCDQNRPAGVAQGMKPGTNDEVPGRWAGAAGQSAVSSCSFSCSDGWLGDRYCDTSCNKRACGYDMGDCGIGSLLKLPSYQLSTSDSKHSFNHSLS